MPEPENKQDNICSKSKHTYVAFDPDKKNGDIIASGHNVGKVIDSARGQGVDIPAIMFIPQEGITYIY